MEYIWKKFPEEIIKGDNITESGFNYEEEYEKEFIKRYGWTLLGIVAGMVGGYLYWRYVGCTLGLAYHFFSCQQFHWGRHGDCCSVHLCRSIER